MEKIFTYDTTLRDGTQGEDVAFSAEDKIKIARHLDAFGIDYIEGGWPGSNPKDMEFFERMRQVPLAHAKLSAFGSTRRPKNSVESDTNVQALLDAQTPVVTIFGKTWLFHVKTALQITEEENLEIISDTVRYLKAAGREVIYDAEHFFDGYKSEPAYALSTLQAAARGGATTIVLCDTNGGTLPWDVASIVTEVRRVIPAEVTLGIHTHNDADCAVPNALEAVRNGCTHVQGTMNGYGERCGNANLCSIIPVLELKMNRATVGPSKLHELTQLSHYVSELANVKHRKNLPFVGTSAFAHKGGIHVSAVMKSPLTYEHIDPALVGNARRVLISDLSGKSNIIYKAQELGVTIDNDAVASVVEELKALEHDGYQYEDAEGSFELLVKKSAGMVREFFALERFKVSIHKDSMDVPARSEAVIKIRVGGISEITAAEGTGPVNALDRALRKALERFYPQISHMHLSDYKVRVLDTKQGTEAKVRVLVETEGESASWNTVGVSQDVVEASWKALVDSVSYHLLKDEECETDRNESTQEEMKGQVSS
ncbi:MAG TPA: citramalate synthase [Bacteroidota bacterium]|nr:citramalate synthase [Bacteroidota bacterium]